ncbi:MAG: DUF5911 domain-containing protein, partial [Proteobacteria bacterium]|nr:DUF5911 domain-containing protein [Pseudomonadota bacterium]
MDLFTASRRLDRTFECDGSAPGLDEHGLVGDGSTCALVGVDGSIAWLCLPRFDSPSVFASILDPERGGVFQVAPAFERFESLQAYDGETNVLQTLLQVPDRGCAILTDFMPWNEDTGSSSHELHRLVEVRDGVLPLRVVF